MSIKILEFRKIDKGSLYGFCNVRIDAWHMEIRSISVFFNKGQFSFALPSKEYQKDDGTKGYSPLIKLDENAYGRMQIALRASLEEYLKTNAEEKPEEKDIFSEMPF